MTIERAVQHFHFKLSNVWNATESDIKAFDTVKNYVIKNQKQNINDNQLFAKLYVFLYGEFLNYYKATVFDNIPQKELNKVLETPLPQIIENFRKQLNESERYQLKNKSGLIDKHPATMSKTEKQKETEINKNLLSSNKINETYFDDIWSYKEVESNLVAQINNALNNFK